MLKNAEDEYLVGKISFDTAENEPCKVFTGLVLGLDAAERCRRSYQLSSGERIGMEMEGSLARESSIKPPEKLSGVARKYA